MFKVHGAQKRHVSEVFGKASTEEQQNRKAHTSGEEDNQDINVWSIAKTGPLAPELGILGLTLVNLSPRSMTSLFTSTM